LSASRQLRLCLDDDGVGHCLVAGGNDFVVGLPDIRQPRRELGVVVGDRRGVLNVEDLGRGRCRGQRLRGLVGERRQARLARRQGLGSGRC
jgi:hypothetical protein